ncbi:MAG: tyrosine recombinase XerC [Mediterranea massiliensis]|nr:tyrosine recombinase XerC [Mediterranea massiliensis]
MLLIDSFLEYLNFERNYSEKTIRAYRDDILQFEAFVNKETGDLTPEEVEAPVIREWVISLMNQGYTSTSINRKLSSLRSFYRFLLRRGLITVDPVPKVVRPKNKKVLPTFVREEDMDRLLDEADCDGSFEECRNRMVILMFYSTGMRRAELIGLDDKDVDCSTLLIKVTGKRNKQRLIPFGEELRTEIQEYLNKRKEAVGETSGPFLVKNNGERLTESIVTKIVKQGLSKVTTVKKRSPHVLRHTFATTMLNNEAELGAIKELLGHESLAATEIYTHTTFEELKRMYNQAHPRA